MSANVLTIAIAVNANHIEDTQRLVAEIEMLKVVFFWYVEIEEKKMKLAIDDNEEEHTEQQQKERERIFSLCVSFHNLLSLYLLLLH
ncbi:MAG: hypothetical protein M3286_09155 [Thermoproteota archaeon]|nr:hypothetical protein [Thermoproteota archaeon]